MKKFLEITKRVLIIVMILASLFIVASKNRTQADAGYHSSYGGGSSHHSSSSHSSSSSSRSSYSSSSSSGSYSGGGGSIGSSLAATIIVVGIVLFILLLTSAGKKAGAPYVPPLTKLTPNQAAIDKLKQLIPGFDEKQFLDEGYKIFLDVENAWMNFELEKIHNEITDELFNMYESQISSMEVKGEQNIMSDFVLKDCVITECKNENDDIEVTTKYIIEFYDYIIDKASGKVLRGTKTRKLRMYYDFTFIKSKSESKIDTCPNCGAEVNVNSAGVCEYCGSKIVGENTTWVMSKKVCTNQVML